MKLCKRKQPVASALRRLSQEGNGFEANLGYLVRPCLKKKRKEKKCNFVRSGWCWIKYTTTYKSHASILFSSHLPQTSLAYFFNSILPSSSSSCWCQQQNWTFFKSERYNLGWEIWSESWNCGCRIFLSFHLLSIFPHLVVIPQQIGGDLSKWARGNMRADVREEMLGQDFFLSVQGLCFLFAELLFPQHAMFSWQNRS